MQSAGWFELEMLPHMTGLADQLSGRGRAGQRQLCLQSLQLVAVVGVRVSRVGGGSRRGSCSIGLDQLLGNVSCWRYIEATGQV